MGVVLLGLTRLVVRWRWFVVVAWLLILAAATIFLPSLSSVIQNDNAAFLPAGAPSVRAEKLAGALTPSGQDGGVLVALSKHGPLSGADFAAIAATVDRVQAVPFVGSVGGGATSADGEVRTVSIQFTRAAAGGGRLGSLAVKTVRSRLPTSGPVAFYLTGGLPVLVDQQGAASHTESNVVLASVLLILVLLLFGLRAVGAPLAVLATAGLALAVADPVIAWTTHLGVQISSLLELLLTALVLGAGTDYGLFLLFRYRENLARQPDHDEAIIQAMARVGRSITFSAATVIAALLSLLLASFGLYRGVGPGLAIGVAVVLALNLTFLPACLSILGPRVFWPWRPDARTRTWGWGLVAARTVTRPLLGLTAVVVLLGALSLFLVDFSSSGFTAGGAIPGSESAVGAQVVAQHFGALQVSSDEVVVEVRRSIWANPRQITAYRYALLDSGLFSAVSGGVDGRVSVPAWWVSLAYRYLGPPQGLTDFAPAGLGPYARWYDAYRATASLVSASGRVFVLRVALSAGFSTSTPAMHEIPSVRLALHSIGKALDAERVGITGTAAAAYDVSQISTSDMTTIVPVVLVVLALLLALLVGSLVAPLYLVLTVGLSYLAALGLTVIIFVVIGGGLGVNFTLPFFMFVFVMALGQDYNILVMSRIKEEAARQPLGDAVAHAVRATGTTVTSAGLVLAGTFGVLAATVSGQVRQIGVGLALGILLDTFLVRTVLLPATVVLLGRWNWWPGTLRRPEAVTDP